MEWLEHISMIGQIILSILAGTSPLAIVLFYRLKRREKKNQVFSEQYSDTSDIVKHFSSLNADLASQTAVERLRAINAEAKAQVLENRLKNLTTIILHECHCEAKKQVE